MLKDRQFEGMEPRFLETIDLSEVYFVRFRPGEDLFETLAEIIKGKNMERAVILSGIGSLCNVAFRDLKTWIDLPVNVDKTNLMEEYGPFELLTLEGNVVPLVGEFGNLHFDEISDYQLLILTRTKDILRLTNTTTLSYRLYRYYNSSCSNYFSYRSKC